MLVSTMLRQVAACIRAGVVALLLVLPLGMAPALSAELVMFERTGCMWCARWDREVGAVYPVTKEAHVAPLRKVNIDRGVPEQYRLTPPVFYSPTFVVIEDGRELGRITGYMSDDAFWGLLGAILKPAD